MYNYIYYKILGTGTTLYSSYTVFLYSSYTVAAQWSTVAHF